MNRTNRTNRTNLTNQTNRTEHLKSEPNRSVFGQRPKDERLDNGTKSENAEIRTFRFWTSTVFIRWVSGQSS